MKLNSLHLWKSKQKPFLCSYNLNIVICFIKFPLSCHVIFQWKLTIKEVTIQKGHVMATTLLVLLSITCYNIEILTIYFSEILRQVIVFLWWDIFKTCNNGKWLLCRTSPDQFSVIFTHVCISHLYGSPARIAVVGWHADA